MGRSWAETPQMRDFLLGDRELVVPGVWVLLRATGLRQTAGTAIEPWGVSCKDADGLDLGELGHLHGNPIPQ